MNDNEKIEYPNVNYEVKIEDIELPPRDRKVSVPDCPVININIPDAKQILKHRQNQILKEKIKKIEKKANQFVKRYGEASEKGKEKIKYTTEQVPKPLRRYLKHKKNYNFFKKKDCFGRITRYCEVIAKNSIKIVEDVVDAIDDFQNINVEI